MTQRKMAPVEERPEEKNRRLGIMDRLSGLQAHFGRFLWDIMGVILMAFALMTILGILGLSQGTLMNLWVDLIKKGLGWGSVFIVASAVILGIYAIRRSRH